LVELSLEKPTSSFFGGLCSVCETREKKKKKRAPEQDKSGNQQTKERYGVRQVPNPIIKKKNIDLDTRVTKTKE